MAKQDNSVNLSTCVRFQQGNHPVRIISQAGVPFGLTMDFTPNYIEPDKQSIFMNKGKIFTSVLLTDHIKIVVPLILKVSKDIVPEMPATVHVRAIIPFIVCTLLK